MRIGRVCDRISEGSLNLYVRGIGEPPENELRIVVAEGLLGETTAIEFAGHDLSEGRPIEITDASRRFETRWDSYVAYAVSERSASIRTVT
jgi:hypothetical protein